jgi:sodium-dependent dicarboxylate transporter 2/3/5
VQGWLRTYLPESLPPVLAAACLFLIRTPQGPTVLERSDLRSIDWDTLFLIAGGLCLGALIDSSGAARALAASVAEMSLSPAALMLAIGAATVLLSELTSNTATAALMVPLAAEVARQGGLEPLQAVWMVCLSASLGFAMPISTPPNAIVYGTGLVRLRTMAGLGLLTDVLALLWVFACVRLLA